MVILLKIIFMILTLAFLYFSVGVEKPIATLLSMSIETIVFSLIAFAFMEAIIAKRFSLIVQSFGFDLKLLVCFNLIIGSHFFNQTLPSSISGDIFKGLYLLKISQLSLIKAVSAVFFDKLFGFTALVLIIVLSLSFIGFNFDNQYSPLLRQVEGLNIPNIFLICAFILILFMSIIRHYWRSGELRRYILSKANALTKNKSKALRDAYPNLKKKFPHIITLSIGAQLFPIMIVYVSAVQIDPSIDLLTISSIVPLVIIASSLPISIGGWGVREASFAALFALHGLPADLGLSCGLLLGLVNFTAGLAGGVVLIFVLKYKSIFGDSSQ
ncbi:flippase-like domain-containing protein [Alphaproteobacteria bacterium]|nr:flippase-like domain-containing protein [Alphaproteobacteria bacterium]